MNGLNAQYKRRGSCYLTDVLPASLIQHVSSFLSCRDTLTLIETCKFLELRLSSGPGTIWKRDYERTFDELGQNFEEFWKKYGIQRHLEVDSEISQSTDYKIRLLTLIRQRCRYCLQLPRAPSDTTGVPFVVCAQCACLPGVLLTSEEARALYGVSEYDISRLPYVERISYTHPNVQKLYLIDHIRRILSQRQDCSEINNEFQEEQTILHENGRFRQLTIPESLGDCS
eukprot:233220_1